MSKSIKKVEGKKVKTYKGCQIYLNNGVYQVHYKGEVFDCPNMDFVKTFIDSFRP